MSNPPDIKTRQIEIPKSKAIYRFFRKTPLERGKENMQWIRKQ